jgi:cytochrome c-type biogenesis protein CcmE
MRKKAKVITISLIILSIIGYLVYTGIRDTGAYYLTVSELLASAPDGKAGYRVGGLVVPESVRWNSRDLKLTFLLGDKENEKSILKVNYQGVLPDTFQPGKEVIVEGTYAAAGIFSAATVMPRCPSKYE